MIRLPHGETNITIACQNRCVSCNHFVAIQRPWFIDPEIVRRDLTTAARLVHFDVYNMVGGEPTLYPRIVEIAHIIRDSGITDRVEITSNGQGFARLPDALFEAIDDLIVTPYKLSRDEISLIIDRCAEHNVSLQWHPVIFTFAGYKTSDAARGQRLYDHCWYRHNRNVIDEGYFHRCCIGRFIPELLQGRDRNADAIALDGLTEERLREFLDYPEAPEMCVVCGCNNAPGLPWREERDPQKWLEDSLYG